MLAPKGRCQIGVLPRRRVAAASLADGGSTPLVTGQAGLREARTEASLIQNPRHEKGLGSAEVEVKIARKIASYL